MNYLAEANVLSEPTKPVPDPRVIHWQSALLSVGERDRSEVGGTARAQLEADEFLRRFLLHVVPRGFVRMRHFGLLANRTRRAALPRCRALLGQPPTEDAQPESVAVLLPRLTGKDVAQCPVCGQGRMQITTVFVRGVLPPDSS